ncbi:DUF3099 domain-containing protein [uncultured Friedmanniella sp.]|uniref:DUF3099 domain-containing protein n=1 Tax=uncultured Friedmanniella sp. TaxID=335381 RepID=UPI0035CBC6E7
MTTMVTSPGDRSTATPTHHLAETSVITDARTAGSQELSSRVRRYTYAMAFRMACFLAMIFVEGWLRWVLLAVAVFMPYLAVVLANQSDQRSADPVDAVLPEAAPALTSGVDDVLPGEIITGEIVSESVEAEPLPRAA